PAMDFHKALPDLHLMTCISIECVYDRRLDMPERQPGPREMMEENSRVSSQPETRPPRKGCGGAPASGTRNPLREERVQEDEKGKKLAYREKVPLKNDAGRLKIGSARCWEDDLRHLLEKDPEHFRALRAIVEGRADEVSKEQLRFLRKHPFLGPDLTPLP